MGIFWIIFHKDKIESYGFHCWKEQIKTHRITYARFFPMLSELFIFNFLKTSVEKIFFRKRKSKNLIFSQKLLKNLFWVSSRIPITPERLNLKSWALHNSVELRLEVQMHTSYVEIHWSHLTGYVGFQKYWLKTFKNTRSQ